MVFIVRPSLTWIRLNLGGHVVVPEAGAGFKRHDL